jgi:hypothetical protein
MHTSDLGHEWFLPDFFKRYGALLVVSHENTVEFATRRSKKFFVLLLKKNISIGHCLFKLLFVISSSFALRYLEKLQKWEAIKKERKWEAIKKERSKILERYVDILY